MHKNDLTDQIIKIVETLKILNKESKEKGIFSDEKELNKIFNEVLFIDRMIEISQTLDELIIEINKNYPNQNINDLEDKKVFLFLETEAINNLFKKCESLIPSEIGFQEITTTKKLLNKCKSLSEESKTYLKAYNVHKLSNDLVCQLTTLKQKEENNNEYKSDYKKWRTRGIDKLLNQCNSLLKESTVLNIGEVVIEGGEIRIEKKTKNKTNKLMQLAYSLLDGINKSAKENNKLLTELVKLDSHIQDNNKILNELGSSANETKKENGVTFKDDIKAHKYYPNKHQTNKPSNASKIKSFLNLIGSNKGEGKVAPLPSITEGDFSNIGEEGKKSSKKQTEKGLSGTSKKSLSGFLNKLLHRRETGTYKIYPLY